jgi:ATP-binding cassette subfamily F protein 1
LKKYTGGLLLVTHDARLVQATQCDIWICKGEGEILGKAASFEKYRCEVLSDLAKRQAAAEAEAKKRAAARKKRREEMAKKASKAK